MLIKIMQNVLAENAKMAGEIRDLLKQKKILMINLISSPGSGKTSLLEKTLPFLKAKYRVAVIEGDVETDKDAKRLENSNVPIALINTSGACHLESVSIEKAFSVLDLDNLDIIFVENVGNLVCPAEFDIGEDMKVALVSTPEGDDKPSKYPLLFREASLAILNKIDLLQHVDFNLNNFSADVQELNPNLSIIKMSCRTGEGLQDWFNWLETKIASKQRVMKN
ncbi:MAG: hydrogenase nickel incorporation protein HypB [Gammaproteobacteria bacterium]|nr:hydrogenase nickel incorporation protein HypB [Gammaproteobacteria bacterium]